MSRRLRKLLGFTLIYAVIVLLFGALNLVRGRIEMEGRLSLEPTRELLYLPDWQVMHAVSLNEDLTAADLMWIRGVFYMSAQAFEAKQLAAAGVNVDAEHGSHDHSYCQSHLRFGSDTEEGESDKDEVPDSINFFDYDFREHPVIHDMLFWNIGSEDARHLHRLLDNVTTLDPLFVTPYISGSMNLALMAGRPDEALRLLDKGVANRPDSWEIYYHRGFLKLFYYNDKIGAAEDIGEAAAKPGAIPIVISLAASLQAGLKGPEFAIEFLKSLRELSGDEQVRQQIGDILKRYSSGN